MDCGRIELMVRFGFLGLVRMGREPVKPEEILRVLGKELPPRPAQRLSWAPCQ
jgi:hypothetical protein